MDGRSSITDYLCLVPRNARYTFGLAGHLFLGFRSQMAKNGTLIGSSCLSVCASVCHVVSRSLKNYTVETWYVDAFCEPHEDFTGK